MITWTPPEDLRPIAGQATLLAQLFRSREDQTPNNNGQQVLRRNNVIFLEHQQELLLQLASTQTPTHKGPTIPDLMNKTNAIAHCRFMSYYHYRHSGYQSLLRQPPIFPQTPSDMLSLGSDRVLTPPRSRTTCSSERPNVTANASL
jgi:hypothetical protein